MKIVKILLLSAALLCGSIAFAQQSWNASVGYTTTTFRGEDCSNFLIDHHLRGFYAGISHEFYFSALAGLTFEPGLRFVYQSGRNDADAKPKYIKMHYLNMPLDVKYTFNITEGATASVFTGPEFNVGIIGNLFQDDMFYTLKALSDSNARRLTRVNLQWGFGAAVTIAEAVQIRVSYALGMSRLIPEQEVHSNTFSIGAGLLF